MRVYPSSVVGLPFPNHDGVLCHLVATLLATGDAVELRRDRDNLHDPDAIAVYAIDEDEAHQAARGLPRSALHHVGWVPRRHAGWIGEQLDRGGEISAVVGAIRRDPRGRIVDVSLAVEMPSSRRATADFTTADLPRGP